MYTVILSVDGINRSYPCASYFDAVVLISALEARYGAETVELWRDAQRER